MSIMKTLTLGALLPAAFALAQSSTGRLQGSVTDPQGHALPGAEVRYLSVAPSVAAGMSSVPLPGETVVTGAVSTDADGGFALAGMPPAVYLLCANVPSAPYIDPCIWRQSLRVTVPAGATAKQNLTLEKGVYLNVRINDPIGLLPQAVDGPWTPRKLLVGVKYGTGAYQGAANTTVDSAGRNYQLIVPAGMAFWLWLYSSDVALTDANAVPVVAPGAQIPFETVAAQNQSFTFTVSGPASHAQ